MTELGNKIKDTRKRKGLSQEELAESARVNLRTIQRIENKENEPRGKTLQLICEALDINAEDILDYGKEHDKNYLIFFHLSVLTFLVIPLGNIIIPLILWLNKKDKIIGLNTIGVNLLNFQILWTFLSYSALFVGVFSKITHVIGGMNPFDILTLWGIFSTINIILPIIFAVKVRNGKIKNFYPNIIRLIK
ncbi:DUF4870 domain-containing protein [Tamlana flava]|uniref:DUF4870 domain-containing protein n=1 Tax=Tamlana flava TaxID=3158572 RepID=UPI00351BE727